MEQKTEASQAVKFRKKPVEIEAIQWTGKLECLDAFSIPELHQSLGSKNVGIPTLEGTMIAHVGDWIIKGVKGEFYPCKPDIFELTYERAALKAQPAPTEAAQGAQLSGNSGELAQGADSARLDCKHLNTRPDWDWVECKDCRSIFTGYDEGLWGLANKKWFKSVSEAKFYKDHGRLPQEQS